jgi:thymidylate synthase (FAD)
MANMKVELIESAGGDLSVVNSARVSFNKESSTLDTKDEKLINYLAKHRHDTPFRHNFIQLRCSVPLFLARQLMKHQAGLTWNEESKRYVDDLPAIFYPDEWRERPEKSIKQGSGKRHKYTPRWSRFYEAHMQESLDMYRDMIRDGIAPEMARMVLPQSMMVNFIWSGNLLAFYHVWNLRSGAEAQEEAQLFAELLREAIEPAFPKSWQALEMRDGICPECQVAGGQHKLDCGRGR